MTSYWLMKSEPDVYSIDMLARDGRQNWDGVRNYTARNNMRAMALGDLALFYHSSCEPPGVVGLMRIAKLAHPDPSQFDPKNEYYDAKSKREAPRWDMVTVEPVQKAPNMVTLEQLKADPKLEGMVVRERGSRLSVQPVSAKHFAHVVDLAGIRLRK
ncbi:MAG TPA: EVE domain-containing protein [Burkholderiales bacterium]|nr:EVE domain-containing protein [Burkholderiales bacterium]